MPSETRMIGLLIPVGWNPEGDITMFALATMDEKVIVLQPENPNCHLLPYLRKKVELRGVYESALNPPTFRVRALRPLKEIRSLEG